MSNEFMKAEEVASYLGCNPQTFRNQAKTHPEKLGFPVTIIGNRVLTPRKPFFNFISGGENNDNIICA